MKPQRRLTTCGMSDFFRLWVYGNGNTGFAIVHGYRLVWTYTPYNGRCGFMLNLGIAQPRFTHQFFRLIWQAQTWGGMIAMVAVS